MRHHADSMRYDRMYTLLWIYTAALALFGLFLGPLDQILPGQIGRASCRERV